MMKKGKLFRMTALCGALFLLAFWSSGVQAQETGSLQLLLPEEAIGAEMTLYPVAYLQEDVYVYSEAFAQSGIEIADLNDTAAAEEAAEQLAAYAHSSALEGTVLTADSESMVFDDLVPALYLTVQSAGEEKIEIQPALVTVPRMSYGVPVYDVTISPKYSFPEGAVIINKENGAGDPLAMAYFTLQSKVYTDTFPEGAQAIADETGTYYWKEYHANLVTDANGQIVVTDLPLGSYRFVETQAPEGYQLLADPVVFEIERAGTVAFDGNLYQGSTGDPVVLQILNYPLPGPEPETESELESETESETEPQTESETEPQTEPESETESESETQAPGTPAGGSSGGNSGGGGGSSPKTGDETPVFACLLLLLLSGGIFCILLSRRRG